jgi:thiol-disulfide isomerase/thioredoxin
MTIKSGILTLISFFLIQTLQAQYEIKVKVEDFPDDKAFLSYFYGKGQFYRDTAAVNEKGEFVFSGTDTLEHGMYSVLAGNKKVFDFLVDEQKLSFETDTSYIVGNMKVKGGKENQLFYDYLQFLSKKNREVAKLRKEQANFKSNSPEFEALRDKMNGINDEVRAFIDELHEKHPGSFTSNFIYAVEYPEVPEAPEGADSTFGFKYFKAHFFDNFAFDDSRLLRTSTFNDKTEYYLEKLTRQHPDSIIEAVDLILSKVRDNPTLYKYELSHLTSKYERSQIMGMDAVFVHLAKNYFMKEKPEWFTKKNLERLAERANALDPLLLGKKAPNIIVKDTAMERFIQLYDVEAKFTIVYIWSPDCGHCKKATPKLKEVYDRYKDKGVEVFAVGSEFENEAWKQFIIDFDLNWINGSDGGDFRSNFRTLYDVYSTPQTYLLDENKEILAKKMSVESLENMLEFYLEKAESEEKADVPATNSK